MIGKKTQKIHVPDYETTKWQRESKLLRQKLHKQNNTIFSMTRMFADICALAEKEAEVKGHSLNLREIKRVAMFGVTKGGLCGNRHEDFDEGIPGTEDKEHEPEQGD